MNGLWKITGSAGCDDADVYFMIINFNVAVSETCTCTCKQVCVWKMYNLAGNFMLPTKKLVEGRMVMEHTNATTPLCV